jgi:hypothetical protein
MTRGVKFRRGSTSDHNIYVGLEGEITVNTDKDVLVVHNGEKLGGFEQVGSASTQRIINKDIEATTLIVTGVTTATSLGVTGLTTSMNLNVVGVTTAASLGVTGLTTSMNLNVVGFVTATKLDSAEISAEISTIGTLGVTGLTTSMNLNVVGVTTAASLGVTGLTTSMNLNVVGFVTATSFKPNAGTTSNAPILLTSGANLSNQTSGAIEYDGNLVYATPKSNRGVILTPQYFVLDSDKSGPTLASTPDSILGSTVTLKAGTRYLIELYLTASKSSANSCAAQILTTSSSGTIDRTIFRTNGSAAAARTTLSNGQVLSNSVAGHITATTVTAANATANAAYNLIFRAWVDVNSGQDVTGYDIQLQWTNVPTTTTFFAGSNVSVYPMGPIGANTIIGSWV